jgi:D-alanyl-D-alanine carboxypeptidase (penicillin-binding protein 5/6)
MSFGADLLDVVSKSRMARMNARRFVALLWIVSLLIPIVGPRAVRAQGDLADSISSRRYIVIDADTGEVFAEQDADDEVAIASLTKIFTTIEALELAPLDTEITTDDSDLFDSNSTTMGFGPGETFTLEQLIYGMLLPSGNDAAHAIARTLGAEGGDSPDEAVNHFVALTNERLQNMGLSETKLVNPHGLGVPGHHSSAHDLAIFMMYALKYPAFVDAISTKTYDANGYELSNTNKLLNQFDGLIGGKTGYDDDSGYCLVEVARRGDDTMISVTLDGVAPDVWYQDNAILLDYAFEQKARRVADGEPITERVSYRDPDAAVVAQIATSSASLGTAETSVSTAPAAAGITPEATAVASVAATKSGGGTNWSLVAAISVMLLVVLASVGVNSLRPANHVLAGGHPAEAPVAESGTE